LRVRAGAVGSALSEGVGADLLAEVLAALAVVDFDLLAGRMELRLVEGGLGVVVGIMDVVSFNWLGGWSDGRIRR
jgi:hypothetical protein